MDEQIQNQNIDVSSEIKTIPVDGMDLLSNKNKFVEKQNNNNYKEEEIEDSCSEIDVDDASDVESLSSVSGSELSVSSKEASVASDDYDEESFEDIQREKQELLFKLNRLEKSGYKPTKHYSMDSRIEDIRSEFKTLKKQRDLEKSIKFSREMLMACVGGIEYLNGKFDPLDVKLDGWSESIMENVTNYDDVFEELYHKYNEKVDVAPEIKLIMMVGGSAFMYHLTNSLFKTAMPNVNEILKQNPGLMANIQQATMNSMGGGQQQQQQQASGNMFSNMMGMMGGNREAPSRQATPMEKPTRDINTSRRMNGPTGVDDILHQLHGKGNKGKRGIDLGI